MTPLAQRQKMADSLAKVLKSMSIVKDSIKKYQDSVSKGRDYSNSLNDSISKISERYNNLLKENENTKSLMKDNSKALEKKI